MPEQADLGDYGANDVEEANLNPSGGYFDGYRLSDIARLSRRDHGLGTEGSLYRHSYLYSATYPISGDSRDDYREGKIELRGRTWTRTPEPPEGLKTWIKVTAHAAGAVFDTDVQTPKYDGYLSGFNCFSASTAWESEEVGGSATSNANLGVVTWNVEVYGEGGALSGIAQGLSHPWRVRKESNPGKEPVSIPPHKWGLSYNDAADEYDVHPPGRSRARQRYQPGGAAHDKTVHINGKPIGKLDSEGRTWLNPAYKRGDPNTSSGSWGTYWSREGLIETTEATPQALRDGGNLYLVGETETGIYLRTSRALPEGYDPTDPEQVPPALRVEEGREPTERLILSLQSTSEALPIECRRDDREIRHLGYSMPTHTNDMTTGWRV